MVGSIKSLRSVGSAATRRFSGNSHPQAGQGRPPINTEPEMSQSIHNGVSKVLIDHVVVTVGDQLEATADRYQRLGFNLTERGHHTLGSSNYLAIFETDYLELLGFLPGRETSRADLWRDPPGLTGLVFKPGDPDARYADLQARGAAVAVRRRSSAATSNAGGRRGRCSRSDSVPGNPGARAPPPRNRQRAKAQSPPCPATALRPQRR